MQILVVVANTPVRPWRTDVEKASMGTAVGHGSVDPKVDNGKEVIKKNLRFLVEREIKKIEFS